MRFPQARVSHQDNRLGFNDILTPSQVEDALLVEFGNNSKVKIGQFLDDGKTRGFDPLPLPVQFSLGDLLFGQGQQKAVVTEVGLGRIFGKLSIVLDEGGQPQAFEVFFQQQVRLHRHPPANSWS